MRETPSNDSLFEWKKLYEKNTNKRSVSFEGHNQQLN